MRIAFPQANSGFKKCRMVTGIVLKLYSAMVLIIRNQERSTSWCVLKHFIQPCNTFLMRLPEFRTWEWEEISRIKKTFSFVTKDFLRSIIFPVGMMTSLLIKLPLKG